MSTKAQPQKSKPKKDVLLWTMIFVLIIAAIGIDYYFSDIAWTLRLAGWIVLACIVVFLIMLTSKGKQIWKFAKEARIEMRKVVWPTRQVTVRTTAIVIALVLLVALIIWGIDAILLWLITLLTG
jgi:preprotein translocase subunit SecE